MDTVTAEPLEAWPQLFDYWRQLDVPEGWKAEIHEWGITMSPWPALGHFAIADLVNKALVAAAPGFGIHQNFPVEAPSLGRLFLPDFAVMSLDALEADGEAVSLPLDKTFLVVEITSPSNAFFDRGVKRDTYAAGGVPLYLLIDRCARPRKVCTLYSEPTEGEYVRVTTVPFGEPVHLPEPFDTTLDTSRFR